MGIIQINRRSCVSAEGTQIKKKFYDSECYETEKEVYNRLEGKLYIPKKLQINDEKLTICIEKINSPDLNSYIKSEDKIPPYLLKSLELIRKDLLSHNLYDFGDFFKREHIFIDSIETSPETMGIRIIDFDHYDVDIISDIPQQISEIEKEFKELNINKNKFKSLFNLSNENNLIDRFFEDKKKFD